VLSQVRIVFYYYMYAVIISYYLIHELTQNDWFIYTAGYAQFRKATTPSLAWGLGLSLGMAYIIAQRR